MDCAIATVTPVSRAQVVFVVIILIIVIGIDDARLTISRLAGIGRLILFIFILVKKRAMNRGTVADAEGGLSLLSVVMNLSLRSLTSAVQFVEREFSAWGRQVAIQLGCLPIGAILAPLVENGQSANHYLESVLLEYSPASCCA